jgi:nitrogen fixation protein NifU and related proteins
MFSPQLLNHFQQPRNVGELEQATAVADVQNPVCGDVLRLTLRIEAGRIVAARFRAQGCVASIACASMLTELITGQKVEDAVALRASELASALGGLPQASSHAADLAINALKTALSTAAEA